VPGAAGLAVALAAGVQAVVPGARREWASVTVGDALGLGHWAPRGGGDSVLREPPAGGTIRQIGRFHDRPAAVALATAP